MAFSALAKVLVGVTVVGIGGGASYLLLKDSSNQKVVVPDTNVGKFYLANNFKDCHPLLDQQSRNSNKQQIYACPTVEGNKLNMVYYEENDGTNKFASKVKELKQIPLSSLQHELIITLEDSSVEKKLTWPSSVFEYTDPKSLGKGKEVLKPSEECVFTSSSEVELFKCANDSWKVIKRRSN